MQTCRNCGATEEFETTRSKLCNKCKEAKKMDKKGESGMTKAQAINLLVDYNIPFSPDEPASDLIARASKIEPEPFYWCEIDDNGQTTLPPWAKVNGRMRVFERGKRIFIRKRYLDRLRSQVTIIDGSDKKTGAPVIKKTRVENITIFKEVPESEVPLGERYK